MKIIFSPSKEMREENIFENKKIVFTESPFKDKTNILIDILKQKSIEEIGSIMKLKADLLAKTYKDIQNYDKLKYIPAISMYYGVSFKELELEAYSEKSLKYLKDKLFILSALYGLSQAFDLVKKYRLDMTMSIVDKGLYNFWKKEINEYISKSLAKDEVLLNLASGEFSKLIDMKKINMINIDFKEEKDGTYTLAAKNDKGFIQSEGNEETPTLMDTLSNISIKKNVLKITFNYFMSAGSWATSTEVYIFRFQNNVFELIGYESNSYMRNTGEEEKVSINFSTNKVKSTTGGNMFEDAKDKPKDKWRNIKFEKKYILDEMTESTMDEILDTIYYIE